MRIPAGFLTLAAGLAAFSLYIFLMAPGVAMEDTGELVTAAGCLGVTHPPGYQWHTLSGRLMMLIPLGTPAFRVGLAGAVFAAAAGAAVFSLGRLLAGISGGVLAFLFLVLSRTFLWQAGLAEKYSLAVCLFGAAFLALVKARDRESPPYLAPAGAFLAGLALSHHWSALPILVPLAYVLRPWNSARAARLGFCFVFPILLRIFLVPLLSSSEPLLDWGDPQSFRSLAAYLGASSYRANALSVMGFSGILESLLGRVLIFPVRENPALVLCIPGFYVLKRTNPAVFRLLALTAGGVVLTGFLAGLPETVPGGERYYLGLLFLLSAAAGAGAAEIEKAGRAVRIAVVLAAAWGASRSVPYADSSRSYFAEDLAANLRASLPKRSAVIAYSYRWFSPLLHDRVINGAPETVAFGPGMLSIVNEPSFSRAVNSILGPLEPPVDRAAFTARLAAMIPEGLFHTYEKAPLVMPAEKGRWEGMLIRIAEGREMKAAPLRMLSRLRYRSFLNPREGYEAQTAEYIARIMELQVRLRPSDPDSVRCARTAVRMAPGQPEIMEALGLAFEETGDLPSAAEVFAFAARMSPSFMEPHLGFARLTEKTGQGDEHFGALMRAVEASRPWDEPVRLSAAALVSSGKASAAIKTLSAAVADEFSRRGWILLEQGRMPEAHRLFFKSLGFDGGNPVSLLGLGRIAVFEEEWEKAEGRFYSARAGLAKRGAEGKPDEKLAVAVEEGLSGAIRAREAAGKLASLKARVVSGDFSAADLVALGRAAVELGRPEWAAACYARAVRQSPDILENTNRVGE